MRLDKFVPKMYKKDIFDINYELLKREGIKCIIFDLDNTIAIFDEKRISSKTMNLLNKLKNDFKIVVMTNNFKTRISWLSKNLYVDFVSFALKPSNRGFKKVQKKYNYSKSEMCVVGDQLITDILGGNNFRIMTVLVDPNSKRDLNITKINRILENKIFRILKKDAILERGKYYES